MLISSTLISDNAIPTLAHAPKSGMTLMPAAAIQPVRRKSLRVEPVRASPMTISLARELRSEATIISIRGEVEEESRVPVAGPAAARRVRVASRISWRNFVTALERLRHPVQGLSIDSKSSVLASSREIGRSSFGGAAGIDRAPWDAVNGGIEIRRKNDETERPMTRSILTSLGVLM